MAISVAIPWDAGVGRLQAFRVPSIALEVGVTHDDDLALVRAVARGDGRAEMLLARRLLPQLRAVARAMFGEGADADDGVQVALMRVFDRLETYRGDAPLERWAKTVAVRACLRLAETNRRHRPTDDDPEDDGLALTDTDDDDQLIEAIPGSIAMHLDRIPPAQREALLLRHALGYSVGEVAELLGLSVDTVKSRLLFGLRALRKSIRRESLPRLRDAAGRGGRSG